jgi:hypothetical protein
MYVLKCGQKKFLQQQFDMGCYIASQASIRDCVGWIKKVLNNQKRCIHICLNTWEAKAALKVPGGNERTVQNVKNFSALVIGGWVYTQSVLKSRFEIKTEKESASMHGNHGWKRNEITQKNLQLHDPLSWHGWEQHQNRTKLQRTEKLQLHDTLLWPFEELWKLCSGNPLIRFNKS